MPVGPKWRQGAGTPLAAIGRKEASDKSVGKDMTPTTGIRFLEIISCRYRRQPWVCQSWGCPPSAAPYPLTPGAPFQGSQETPSAGGRVMQEGVAFLMLDLRTLWAGCTISAHGEPGPTEEGPTTGQPCRPPWPPSWALPTAGTAHSASSTGSSSGGRLEDRVRKHTLNWLLWKSNESTPPPLSGFL